MIAAPASIEDMTLSVTQELRVEAPLDVTFAALLEELGPANETPDGTPLCLTLEAWPGGRWFRDLGDGNGHYWATVQAIKRPALLELCGPMFMSYPVNNHIQYRLTEEGGSTIIHFQHLGFGFIDERHRNGVNGGWGMMHERARKRAEAAAAK